MTRPPDEDDWQNETSDVRRLPAHGRTPRTPAKGTRRINVRQRDLAAPHPKATERTKAGRQIDKSTEKRIKRGHIEVEGRLDLHGYTLMAAYAQLKAFVLQAHRDGKRCVVVVTGRGELPNPDGTPARRGAIRREFPDWMTQPPFNHLVLKILSARAEDGGAGAFYLYLRKSREG